ncbi:hypothetical protein M758_UG256400 [Ceratodon purpureus]|nr:hypothetical protein M758_UG256400 [Ceratodon purpureus]
MTIHHDRGVQEDGGPLTPLPHTGTAREGRHRGGQASETEMAGYTAPVQPDRVSRLHLQRLDSVREHRLGNFQPAQWTWSQGVKRGASTSVTVSREHAGAVLSACYADSASIPRAYNVERDERERQRERLTRKSERARVENPTSFMLTQMASLTELASPRGTMHLPKSSEV